MLENDECLMPLHELAKAIPPLRRRSGELRSPSLVSLYRHTTIGLKGIVMESWQRGATRVSSVAAYLRFCAALTQLRDERRRGRVEAGRMAVAA
jgi:hypothetical protein